MFCKNCGKELSENAFVCPECGELTKGTVKTEPNINKSISDGDYVAITGFTVSLISVACWICYLAVTLCCDSFGISFLNLLGTITGIVCLTGIVVNIAGLKATSYGKLALTGIILSGIFFLAFLLLTCIVGCLI